MGFISWKFCFAWRSSVISKYYLWKKEQNEVKFYISACEEQIDYTMSLDLSPNIAQGEFDSAKCVLTPIITGLDVGPSSIQVGLMTFHKSGTIQFHLDEYTDTAQVISKIQAVI